MATNNKLGMETWAWLLGYVAVFVLFQLVIYRYLRNGDGSPVSGTTPPGHPRRGAADDVEGPFDHASVEEPEEGVVRCPHCGGTNESESTFTYCRNCLRPLGT